MIFYSVAEEGPLKDMEDLNRSRPSQEQEKEEEEEEEGEECHPQGGARHRRRWTSLGFADSQMESTEGSDGGSSGVKVKVKVNSEGEGGGEGEGEGGGRWRSLLLHSEMTAAELFSKPSSPLWTGGAVPFLWEETPGKSKHRVAEYAPSPLPPLPPTATSSTYRSNSHPYNAPPTGNPCNNNPYNSSLRLPPRLTCPDAPTPRTSSKLRLIKKLSVSYGRLLITSSSSSSSSSFYSSHHRRAASFSGSLASRPENNGGEDDDNGNCDTLHLLFSPSEDGSKKPNSSASSASSSSSSSSLPYMLSDKSLAPLTPGQDHPKPQPESPTAMEKKRRSSFRSWMANLVSCGGVKIPDGERRSHPLPELIA